MRKLPVQPVLTKTRRGSIAPAIGVSFLVLGAAIALTLDRAWIDAAQVELTVATDAAALAAARDLATDDLLRINSETTDERMAAARVAATQIAEMNRVAGTPLVLTDADVTFGQWVYSQSSGAYVFLETDIDPRAVMITGIRERSRSNPVGLLMRGVTGQPSADLARRAIATLDNQIVGLRPTFNLVVPALPLAILDQDPTGVRLDTWQAQITARRGADSTGYDTTTNSITATADGIPEIVLTGATTNPTTTAASKPNFCLVDFSTSYDPEHVATMVAHGWTHADLKMFNHELGVANMPITVPANPAPGDSEWNALTPMVGECRICLLYMPAPATASNATSNSTTNSTPAVNGPAVVITGLVAGRIMALSNSSGLPPQIVFQPGVIITRAAETATEIAAQAALQAAAQNPTADTLAVIPPPPASTAALNPYIYKMTLAH
jgi:hypothetical protein